MASLVAASGHSIELTKPNLSVGSDLSVEIPIAPQFGVAPRHFQLLQNADGYGLVILDRAHSVLVNGSPVMGKQLADGDMIQAGKLQLTYRDGTGRADSPVPSAVVHQTERAAVATPTSPPIAPSSALPLADRPPPLPDDYNPLPPLPAHLAAGGLPYSDASPSRPPLGGSVPTAARPRSPEPEPRDPLEEAAERTGNFIESERKNQNLVMGFVFGLIAAALGCLIWRYSSILPMKFFLAVTALIGAGVGWAVRIGGRGFDPAFGYAGACCAVLAGLAANFLSIAAIKEKAKLEREMEAARMAEYKAEFQRNAQALKAQMTFMAEQSGDEALREEVRSDVTAIEAEDWDDEEPAEEGDPDLQPVRVGWILFGLKALLGYFVAAGAAYKASFRQLTNREVKALHG